MDNRPTFAQRLPFALFLSFLVLMGWQLMNPPELPPEGATAQQDPSAPPHAAGGSGVADATDATGVSGQQPEETAGGLSPAVDQDLPVKVQQAAERWQDEWIEIGHTGERGHYWALFDNKGGSLLELRIGGYWARGGLSDEEKLQREHFETLLVPIDQGPAGKTASMVLHTGPSSKHLVIDPLAEVLWHHEIDKDNSGYPVGVTFTHSPGNGITFRKTLRSIPGTYDFSLQFGIKNTGEIPGRECEFHFTPAACMPLVTGDKYYMGPSAVAAWRMSVTSELDYYSKDADKSADSGTELIDTLKAAGRISFVGSQNKYFAVLMRPVPATSEKLRGATWQATWDREWKLAHLEDGNSCYRNLQTHVNLLLHVPASGAPESVAQYMLYAGTKDRDTLLEHHEDHVALADEMLGFFDGIASVLLAILNMFHNLTGNWGWSIILLTITVRIFLFPLNRRSQTAMARHQSKMKRVQPKIDEAKKRYANDKKKQQQEQARIMQEEGAFPPLGGCLPPFLQIPVFFGLFSALRTNFDLRQAPFMSWITDLSEPDRLMRIDFEVPIIGTIEYLNVLPPLMVILWIAQQKFMPKPTDEQAARMQKMMMWMPVVMGFFLYNYAAGLSLYMITQSGLGIIEMGVIKKLWPVDDTEQPKKKSGFMAKLGKMQDEAQRMQEQQQRDRNKGKGKGKGKGGAGGGNKKRKI